MESYWELSMRRNHRDKKHTFSNENFKIAVRSEVKVWYPITPSGVTIFRLKKTVAYLPTNTLLLQ